MPKEKRKILVLDIETEPHLAFVWRLHKEYIHTKQLVKRGGIISVGFKWVGDKAVHQYDTHEYPKETMLAAVYEAYCEADAVVTYNGDSFDIPWLHGEWLRAGFPPPPPVNSIDLIKTTRKLRLASNRLEYAAPEISGTYKVKHEGFDLWKSCMAGDDKAWKRMRRYNIGDVKVTERYYLDIRPWIKNHPYLGEPKGTKGDWECPKCGHTKGQKRGYRRTATTMTERMCCNKCGGWSKGKTRRVA